MTIRTGLIKKTMYKMSQYFSKFYKPFGGDTNFKVYLFSYVTKTNLGKTTGTDQYNPALKSNLAKLKAKVDKIGAVPTKDSSCSFE